MATATMDHPMTAEKPKLVSIKLHEDVVNAARIVAAYKGVTMGDILSDMLRPALAKMEAEEVARRSKAATSTKGGKGKA